jgi:DNA polymerase I
VRFGARLPKRLLVGVDAEGIQLRIFAHYLNDPDLTKAILEADPHEFNRSIFGPCCKTRQAAKHSLYAIFFGGGPGKIAEIMGCSKESAKEAIDRLLKRYKGLARLEKEVFPRDSRRGYFEGLDGRQIKIPGETEGDKKHLCMSGYLQCGEAVVMKLATLKFEPKLKEYNALLINLVHDEWQVECPCDVTKIAIPIAQLMCDSLRQVGEELKLNCPLAGSYKDKKGNYTIATNWRETH